MANKNFNFENIMFFLKHYTYYSHSIYETYLPLYFHQIESLANQEKTHVK